ncbi:MAG: sulfatase family protein [Pleomorphochaeta sp.]
MSKKKNVLLIIADQMRFDTINALGYEDVITPNLDRLVNSGCSFTHCFSSNPVCMPARHDLLVGLPSSSHGYLANREMPIKDYGLPTLPRIFSENGYRTAAIGKMHFYPATMHHGYSEMHLMEELPKVRENDEYAMYLKENGEEQIQNIHGIRPALYHEPQIAQVDYPLYETNWIKDRTIKWLEDNNNNPFFLAVGFIKPHPPWDIPKGYENLYKDKKLRKSVEKSRLFFDHPEHNIWYGDDDSEEEKEKIRKAYYTSITLVDESVGNILDYLEANNLVDDTLIIFTADHGEMLGDKGYYSKELPYDGSVRVPLIMSNKHLFKQNSKNNDLVDLIDIFPTCLEAAELPILKNLYGSSLLDTKKGKDREYVFSASGFLSTKRFVMCQNKKYKYVYHYNGGFEEIYDLENDKYEINNLINEMLLSKELKEFREKVLLYEKEWGPSNCVVDNKLVSFETEMFDPSVHGKYHKWSNLQFQKFIEKDFRDRKKQFLCEFDKAMSHKEFETSNLEYKKMFNECLEQFSNDTLEKY